MDLFFKLFSKRIIVYVSPTMFTFRTKDNSFSIQPSVNVFEENGEIKIFSIGENAPESEPGIKQINIFNEEVHLTERKNKPDFLQAFLEYCIGKIFQLKFLPQVRPVVFILGSNKFDTLLCGFQKDILESAFRSAGASKVFFDRTEW